MNVEQVYSLMNDVTKEILGDQAILSEDLSNVVEIGTQIFNATAVDNYVKTLVDHIGKVIFVNRPYSGNVPSLLMDAWEFGSVLEKVRADLPEAQENESWELQDGASYDPNIFYKPSVSAKFFNKRVTFEVPVSITEKQVKESFSNASQLNGFISMIYNAVDKSMTIKIDALAMRTINNMIGETVYDEFPGGTYTSTGVKAVNLLDEYNTQFSASLTASDAITNAEFIRYASFRIAVYSDRLSKVSNLFNIGGTDKFTPKDSLHLVMLSDFARGADVYLNSDTFHEDYVNLPASEKVPYWQGSGTSYDFDDITSIDIVTASGHAIQFDGILAVMFDRDALGVSNLDRRVTVAYNAKGEFTNNFFKFDAGYFNDTDENFVVFFVA